MVLTFEWNFLSAVYLGIYLIRYTEVSPSKKHMY